MGCPCHHVATLQAEPVQIAGGLLKMPSNTLHYKAPLTTLASPRFTSSLKRRLRFRDSLYMPLAEHYSPLPHFRTNALVLSLEHLLLHEIHTHLLTIVWD